MRSCSGFALLVGIAGCSEFKLSGPEPVADQWVVTGKVDLVVFGDTSDSMGDELTDLGNNIDLLVTRLDDIDADWNLVAITGPDGCGQQGVLNRDVPDWQDKFATGIQTKPGQDLVDEWGLYDASQALEHTGAGDCNAGFLRDDAWLHAIFLSDEDDNSPGWDSGDPSYWQPYVDDFLAAKQDPSKVHLSAVAGPEPAGCSSADPGVGYWEAVAATGGTFLPICEAWIDQIDTLADTSIIQSSFALTRTPDPTSIRVYVDELERTDGWHLDSATDLVVFDSDPPFAGQEVYAAYDATAY